MDFLNIKTVRDLLDDDERADQLVSKIISKFQNNPHFKETGNIQTVVRNVVSRLDPHKSKMIFAISRVVKESKIKLKPKKTITQLPPQKQDIKLKLPYKQKITTNNSIEDIEKLKQSNEEKLKQDSNEPFEKKYNKKPGTMMSSLNTSIDNKNNNFFPEKQNITLENTQPFMKTTKTIEPIKMDESKFPFF